ncbi:MAG: hypothetical protein KC496_01035, partial [Anaerolineae bacterium]|nr:hypothetical protein [Anaerolineae bacterium]
QSAFVHFCGDVMDQHYAGWRSVEIPARWQTSLLQIPLNLFLRYSSILWYGLGLRRVKRIRKVFQRQK